MSWPIFQNDRPQRQPFVTHTRSAKMAGSPRSYALTLKLVLEAHYPYLSAPGVPVGPESCVKLEVSERVLYS
jgi:hypothetical protein